MNHLHIWRRAAVLFLSLTFAAAAAFAGDTALNDNARFLAGMTVAADSPLQPMAKTGEFARHAGFFDRAWANLDKAQLSSARSWASDNLKNTQPTLLYMFSGPDFLYANVFFPNATTYVMAGLEEPGEIPDLTKLPRNAVAVELDALRGSLNSVLAYSFFITQEMRHRLHGGRRLTGTLPVLFTFLARSGKTVKSVEFLSLDKDGTPQPASTALEAQTKAGGIGSYGVKIGFAGEDNQEKTLYYFKTDLSNGGAERSGFLSFCEKLGPSDAFIKSASYLLHGDGFSRVRAFLLQQTASIAQDDSGVPLRYFSTSDWTLEPYGSYVAPIPLFARDYQPNLHRLFVERRPKPLRFSFGYQWKPGSSSVLVARKKEANKQEAGAPPKRETLVKPSGSSM
jgi:hypothetical protein